MLPSAASQFGSSDFYLTLEHPDLFEITDEVIHQYLNYFHAQHAHKMLTANLGCLYLDAIYRTAIYHAIYHASPPHPGDVHHLVRPGMPPP